MTRLILQIYDVLKKHVLLRWASLAVLTVVLGLLLTRQSYKEDISDFLPLDKGQGRFLHESCGREDISGSALFAGGFNIGHLRLERFLVQHDLIFRSRYAFFLHLSFSYTFCLLRHPLLLLRLLRSCLALALRRN